MALDKFSRYIITTLYLIFILIGLFFYLIVIFTLIKKRKQFQNPFYKFAIALGIVDTVLLFLELIYCMPVGYGNVKFPENFEIFAGFLSAWTFFSGSTLMAVISFNRFIGVCFFNFYQTIFSNFNVMLLIIFSLL